MAKDDQAKDDKPADNKMKLYIIIAAAVVVVAVVVAVLLSGGKGEKGEEKEKPAEAKAGHGEAKPGEKGVVANIYALEPFIVNVYDGQEMRYLKVKVEFETAGAEAKAEVEARQSPLRDAILVLLTTKTMQDIQDLQGKNQLRDEILTAANKILPPGKVTRVYFTDFVVQ
ncbi:flagellar basal body-associated protein FliL [Geobacter sp. DSM 9736]|uniref:flagellar basal body-associated FliL family protein n=1 Tax=Geobacter sp. DSM 9736 TaxID=1277350 RepID=UPI000B50D097|nr:flagellar basal body-associated FliL family protein [Geobacter sp. DSM 9736]SNB47052.1 flagellar FliL protein [Geobacter sp. DSM 9736]